MKASRKAYSPADKWAARTAVEMAVLMVEKRVAGSVSKMEMPVAAWKAVKTAVKWGVLMVLNSAVWMVVWSVDCLAVLKVEK